MTQLIRRLRIPVVIMGVGAQSNLRYQTERLGPVEESVRAFVSAVLDRGPSIGVRGEFTHDYLRGLGFRDVEVIGCPSMFFDGDRMPIEKRPPALTPGSTLAMNVTPYVKRMGDVVMSHHARYPNLRYIAQDLATLELLLWGESGAGRAAVPTNCRSTRRTRSSSRTRSASSSTRGRGSRTCAASTSPSARASTATSRRSWPARPPTCSPTIRGRWSWPATSRSRTGA